MFSKSKKSSSSASAFCAICNVVWFVCTVLGALVLFATIMGVFFAHFGTGQAVFGTMSDSLSLLALVGCLFFVKKMTGGCACEHTGKK